MICYSLVFSLSLLFIASTTITRFFLPGAEPPRAGLSVAFADLALSLCSEAQRLREENMELMREVKHMRTVAMKRMMAMMLTIVVEEEQQQTPTRKLLVVSNDCTIYELKKIVYRILRVKTNNHQFFWREMLLADSDALSDTEIKTGQTLVLRKCLLFIFIVFICWSHSISL